MANKAISELPQAQNVNNQDLFVLEQSGIAKKLTAETFITEQGIIDALAEALDGHGGIQSVTLASVSGRIRTYRITFSDGSATTFQVYDGTSIDRISRTSSSGLDDVYTVFLSDGTTTFFTVHNGADGTVSEAMLNDALKDKAPAITETTESSAIANFTDGADDMPLHNILAEINPVQDLPYGAPYPAGGGKNLYSILIGADTFQINVGATFSNVDGTLKIEMTSATGSGVYATSASVIKPLIMSLSGEYTLSFDIKASQSGAVMCGAESFASTPITATTSWQRFSLTSTYATPNTTFICYNRSGNAMTVEVKNLQICLSSATDPTVYAPYSNICPITGHTEVNVTRTGSNLLDVSNAANATNVVESVDADGTIHFKDVSPHWGSTYIGKMYVKSGQTYIISANLTYGRLGFSSTTVYPQASVNIPDISVLGQGDAANVINKNRPSNSFIANYTGDLYVFYCSDLDYSSYHATFSTPIWVNVGSTATTYESYIAPTTTSLSWQTEAGTVYGGTIDVATGVLTVNMAMVDLGTRSWSKSGVRFYTQFMPGSENFPKSVANGNVADAVCSQYKAASRSTIESTDFSFSIHEATSAYITIVDSRYSDTAAFKTAMSGVQLVYELATAQTYQLNPQQLMTLLGTNNVWTDIANVSVTYPADTKMFIEKLTIPTEDDLVANQAITSGQYFMIGNSLYLALANIASGAQITIGTNAQRVSLADALNTINS